MSEKKAFSLFRKKKEVKEDFTLAEGLRLQTERYQQTENRLYTLLLKGLLVYLMVGGAFGCYLSALKMVYHPFVLQVCILLSALFCASLYYSRRWQDIGYFLLLFLMIFVGNGFRRYVNSGFYAVANELYEQISEYFGSNAVRSYGEQIGNRSLAVTISMCYIGVVACILMNILISRKMHYRLAFLTIFFIQFMLLYIELEPFFLYEVMFLTGLLVSYMLRKAGHYRLTEDDQKYLVDRRKERITYQYSSRMLAKLIGLSFAGIFVLTLLLQLLLPSDSYRELVPKNAVKGSTEDTVKNVSTLGLMGLFNFYPNTGGLTNGTLGGVSSVRLDFETDLTLTLAPYTTDRMYFKTFTGRTYLPVKNRWERLTDAAGQPVVQREEKAKRLKKAYRLGKEKTARGRVRIKNVAAASGVYLPYYSDEIDKTIYPGNEKSYTFYPEVSGAGPAMPTEVSEEAIQNWLEVPEENLEVIGNFCQEAGLVQGISASDAVRRLAAYYQENIPYTIRPGITPYHQDFINYFLAKNRRGYCAHFASAATLIFRYLGIPARYVEGYAIDPEDFSEEGTIQYEEAYEDYYKGYSPLGQTAVVSVNATDANAHAWVEVYEEGTGWKPVEVTPASEEEETDNSLWSRIINFLQRNSNQNDADMQDDAKAVESRQNQIRLEKLQRSFHKAGRILLCVALAVALVVLCIYYGRKRYRYLKADRNERLVLRYQDYVRRIKRRQEEFRSCINYREQILWMAGNGYLKQERTSKEQAIRIMEKAGFSAETITEAEFEAMVFCMHKT